MKADLVGNSVVGAALLFSVGVMLFATHRYSVAHDIVAATRLSAARAEAQDHLVGRAIDLGRFRADTALSRSGDPRLGTLVWVVDLDRCSGCFDAVGEWMRLERLLNDDFMVILTGDMSVEIQARLRALTKSFVVHTTREAVMRSFGNTLPSTKLLLDANGIAVLVDSRSSGQDCGWSFEPQVGTMRGVVSASSIRKH
jgi:hypothetical protein